jgi:lipoyl(octanoyl) transferase
LSGSVERWRFMDTGPSSGRHNMAVDLAMARTAAQHSYCSTLRIYAWQPAAISLGFHQSLNDIDIPLCRSRGIDVVYRPTGGRAVLHSNELTYAVVLSPSSRFFKTEIMAVYEQLSRAILAGLSFLQVPADFDRSERTPQNFSRGELSSLCYASAIQHEIGVGGRKLIGSAQRRFETAILQHGSILIGPEHADLAFYLNQGDDTWRSAVHRYMTRHTVCLNELAPKPILYDELSRALRIGFSQALEIDWTDETLSENERQQVEQLERDAEI